MFFMYIFKLFSRFQADYFLGMLFFIREFFYDVHFFTKINFKIGDKIRVLESKLNIY